MKYLYPTIQTNVNINVEYEHLIEKIIRKAKEKPTFLENKKSGLVDEIICVGSV